MHYFAARRALRLFQQHRVSAEQYLDLAAVEHAGQSEDASKRDELRRGLNEGLPELVALASELGVETRYRFPSGTLLQEETGNLLDATKVGHGIATQDLLDYTDRCVGAAKLAMRRGRSRLIFPWFWIVDDLGLIIRFPFLVLRAAGLPASYEQTVWAQAFKLVYAAGLAALAVFSGVQLSTLDP